MKNLIIIILVLTCSTAVVLSYILQTDKEDLTHLELIDSTAVLIPNEKVAVDVGLAILRPLFNSKSERELKFRARLVNDSIWHIYSLSRTSFKNGSVVVWAGGGISIYLHKSNCRVLSIVRSK